MTIDTKRLGYGGSAEIDGVQVLITSGSFDTAVAPSLIEALDIPPSVGRRSRMVHADGTNSHTGSVNFDITRSAMQLFGLARLLNRYYTFDVGINDGESYFKMTDCKLTSLALSGAPGGLLSAQLSVMGRTGKASSTVLNAYAFEHPNKPLGYWWSGNTDVRDWTLSMSQNVTPVYVNENPAPPAPDDPRYLKVGLVTYTLAVTTYSQTTTSAIYIATRDFTLTGVTTAKGYSFGGQTELGMYSHTFESAAAATSGSGGIIIS